MRYTERHNQVKGKFIYYNIYKTFPIHLNISSTLESDKAVEDVLASKGREKTALITKMLDDEKYQREAFQALLLQQDHKALEIGEQMSRIQNELASLTSVELKKKDLKVCVLWTLFITFGKMS